MNLAKLLFISYSVTIAYFMGEDAKNWLLIGCMAIVSVLYAAWLSKLSIDKKDFLFLCLLLAMSFCAIRHWASFRISSFGYSVLFVLSFLYIKKTIENGRIDFSWSYKIFGYLIYVYAIVLMIQQMCVLTGIPVFNSALSAYDESQFKLPSLCPEASHLAPMEVFLMLGHIVMREIKSGVKYSFDNIKKEKGVWFCYFWVMLTSMSTTAMLYSIIPLVRFVKVKNLGIYLCLIGVFLLIMGMWFSDNVAFIRMLNIIPAILSFDPFIIDTIDHSAAYRILPVIGFFEHINVFFLNFWLGEGMDYGKIYFNQYIFFYSGDGTYNEFDGVNVGGFASYIMDYGMVCFLLMIVAFRRVIGNMKDKYLILVWCVLNVFSGFNMQIFWFSAVVCLVLNHYSKCYIRS